MPDWFVPVLAVLIVVAFGFLVALRTTRKRKYALGLAGTGVLIALVWLIAFLLPTDQKRIERALDEMSAGVKAKNLDQVFAHISNEFRVGGVDKAGFRRYAEPYIESGQVTGVSIWEIAKADVSREKKTATVRFMVKPLGPITTGAFFRCEATFVLEEQDQWRMKSFQLFNPAVESNTPIAVPGLGR